MTTYTVTIPAMAGETRREFRGLRTAKRYARSLAAEHGLGRNDDAVVIADGHPGRLARLLPGGRFSYSSAPESWRRS